MQIFEGIKVLDFTWVGVGPIATKSLADHGATVVRVESHTKPEIIRVAPPFKDGIPGIDRSGFTANYNSSKYGISLNLNHPRGREIVRRFLVEWKPDIMAESFAPGTMEGWELDYQHVKELRPDIIYFSASMQGHFGPNRGYVGFGVHMATLGGFTHITGWPDRLPAMPYGAYTDFIACFYGAIVLAAALDYRRKTGKGQYLDLSQLECGIQFLVPPLLDYVANGRELCRMGNRDPHAAPHGVYPCKGEDRWCCIAVSTEEEWQAFCNVLGCPEWTKDPKFTTFLARKENEDELDRLVAEWTQDFTAEEVMTLMQANGIPAGVVETPEDLYNDPQIKHRGFFTLLNHSEMGPHHYDGLSFHLSKTPGKLRMPAPCLGEHNEYVYKEFLGLSDEEIADLIADGAITTYAI